MYTYLYNTHTIGLDLQSYPLWSQLLGVGARHPAVSSADLMFAGDNKCETPWLSSLLLFKVRILSWRQVQH